MLYTTSCHHSSSPALCENLFPSVILIIFLNFNWLILFPRTLILLLVKVLFFCNYQSKKKIHKNVRKHWTGAADWWWGNWKAVGLAMFKSVCKCQTSSTSCQQERWLLFQVGKEKGEPKEEASIWDSDYSSYWVKQVNSCISQSEYRWIASWSSRWWNVDPKPRNRQKT